MPRRRMPGELRRAKDVWVRPDEVQALEQFKVLAMERWALSGKVPPRHEFWQLDPQSVEWVYRRLGVWAVGVQTKILKLAMAEGATETQLQMAGTVAKDVLNRGFGKPTERHQVQAHVMIEFGGLDPDRLPDRPPEDSSEVVDVPPIEGDDNGASHGP